MPRTKKSDVVGYVDGFDGPFVDAPMETEIMEEHDIKFIQRDIDGSGNSGDPNAWLASNVEAYIRTYLNDGWTVKEVLNYGRRLVGESQDRPVFSVMVVLVK